MATVDLTAARLRELLHYDSETGCFHWRNSPRSGVKDGAKAGSKRPEGYTVITINNVGVMAHRLAVLYVTGCWPPDGADVDHVDGERSNNAWANLRCVSRAWNLQNQRKASVSSRSGLLGASWNKKAKRWQATITSGKTIHLGYFDTAENAHAAYITAKRALHPGCTI